LFWVGQAAALGLVYQGALVVVAGLLAYQQFLIRGRDPAACFKAFLNNNWVGFVVFLGIVGHFLTAAR
jgi:4-hydroxybenzoate polyprenyltransferase